MAPGAAGAPAARPARPPAPTATDLDRVRNLLDGARDSFEARNPDRARKQAASALRILGEAAGGEADSLRFEGERRILLCDLRLGSVKDPGKAVADFAARHPGRLRLEDYRGFASDLAFAGDFDGAIELLEGGGEHHASFAGPLGAHARFLERLRDAVKGRRTAPEEVDPHYLETLARNRPEDADGLYRYALRAAGIGVHDKALLALRDAAWRMSTAGEPDPARSVLIAYNEAREWIALGAFDEGLEGFERLVRERPSQTDWIVYHQIGTMLAEGGAAERARRVLTEGKKRFPGEAARFEEALRGL